MLSFSAGAFINYSPERDKLQEASCPNQTGLLEPTPDEMMSKFLIRFSVPFFSRHFFPNLFPLLLETATENEEGQTQI